MARAVPQPLWELIYNGSNITGNIADQVTEVMWMEHLGGRAAEVSVTVEDAAGRWRGSSYPQAGRDLVELSIGYAGAPLLACGQFTVAELTASGPPSKMCVRAIETWQSTPLRTAGNYAYEGMTFLEIAQAVAARHGWTVVGLPTSPDPAWSRRTQTLEHGGDLAYLRKLATEANYEFNVRPPKIIFYSRAAIDTQAPAGTILRSMTTRYEFRFQTSAEVTFGASNISYLDPITKTVHSASARISGVPPTADTLNISERLENSQQASLKASSRLYQQDMLMYQGTIELPGTVSFRAGQTVTLPQGDWGAFGGTWTVSRATHRIRARNGGYVTELLIRQGSLPSELVPAGGES
jgi:phage protein D